jgi:hypothetical protein
MRASLISTFVIALTAIALPALAEDRPFVYSAMGPGAAHGAISLGARGVLIASGKQIEGGLPFADVVYARGLTDRLKLNVGLTSLGLLNFADLGLQWRFLSTRDGTLGLSAKAGATTIFGFSDFAGTNAGGLFAATPGLAINLGSRDVQLTLGADVPLFFGSAFTGVGAESGFSPVLRPNASLEFAVTDNFGLNLGANVMIPLNGNAGYVPSVSLGFTF